MTTVERIFSLMAERGISAYKLSKAVGIAQGNIGDWKSGKSKPSYGALVKIANHLNVAVEYLEMKTDNPSPIPGGVNVDDDLEYIGQKARELPPEQRRAYMEMMKKFADQLMEFNKGKK